MERFCFYTQNQDPERGTDNHVTKLKVWASIHNFGKRADSLITARISLGSDVPQITERLLREADLILDKYLQISRAAKLFKDRIKTITDVEPVYLKEPRSQNKERPT